MYLFAFAVAQLFYGPLSDRYGRRRMTLIGLGIFLVGSVLTVLADSIEVLAAGRALQAIGGCAGMALSRASIRDVYDREKSASMIGYVTMAMVVAPMLASPIGGWMFQTYGLANVLLIPLVAGAITLALCIFGLHETLQVRSAKPVRLGGIVLANLRILGNENYRGYAMTAAFSATSYYIFVACSPFVSETLMGISPAGYGQWFLALSIAYMFGNGCTGRFSAKIGGDRMIWIGLACAAIGLAIMTWLAAIDSLTAAGMFLLMGLVSAGNGFSTPNAIAGAISADPAQAGAAAGMLGFLQMTLGALGGIGIGYVLNETQVALPIAIGMLLATTTALYLFAAAKTSDSGSSR
jgi:DHA1 family bicyclomycin/chloramphenicol resistance-like MFS transporter